jgi:outer membrane cobalamin receptor
VNDSLIISDTLTVNDSLVIEDSVILYDTAIVYPKHFYKNSFKIEREFFIRSDYRYTGDLIEPFQFNFIKDLGIPGQLNESFIYGVGFSGISYMTDGILINNRNDNSFDLNLIQSEDIETIEILPATRGFLYGPGTNPVTVNFLTRDFITAQPYSSIKYYQGPGGEAFVDGSFNALVSKDFQFSFDVTNRKYDSSYINTSFSTWLVRLKAKYYFSSNTYLTASYNYADKKTGLWGGVNRDSIIMLGLQLDDLLYTPDEVPVNNSFRKQNDLLHYSSLRLTSIQSENSRTEFTLYQHFKESKMDDSYNTENDNTTWGINLNQNLGLKPFSFYAALIYEQNNLETWYSGINSTIIFPYYQRKENYFALSGTLSLNLIKNLTPSVFYKFNGITTEFGENNSADYNGSGFGADLSYEILDDISIYIGYSTFDKSFYKDNKTNVFETGLTYQTINYFADVKYFRRENSNIFWGTGFPSIIPDFYEIGDLSGVGLSSSFRYWYLQFETQASAYKANKGSLYSVPDFRFIGGLYFRGNLFDDNLNLKAGLKFTYTGEITTITEYYGLFKVDPTYKLDFLLSGEIRKAAIVYFAIENLLDKQYYITPFYPMPGVSLRFGLAWEFLN